MLQSDPPDPDFPVEQREESDLKAGFLRRSDVHPPIPDVHIIKPDMQVRKETDSQSAANVDLHPQGFGGGPFQPGFVDTRYCTQTILQWVHLNMNGKAS